LHLQLAIVNMLSFKSHITAALDITWC